MLVSVKSLEDKLSSNLNCLNKYKKSVVSENFTNRTGRKNISFDTKVLLGTLSHFSTEKEVAESFNVSRTLVHAAKHGMNGTSGQAKFDKPLSDEVKVNVKDVKKQVSELALGKLTKVLEAITEDKISGAKLTELGLVASSLSKVSKLDVVEEGKAQNNFVFYAPRNKAEDDYKIIEVSN